VSEEFATHATNYTALYLNPTVMTILATEPQIPQKYNYTSPAARLNPVTTKINIRNINSYCDILSWNLVTVGTQRTTSFLTLTQTLEVFEV